MTRLLIIGLSIVLILQHQDFLVANAEGYVPTMVLMATAFFAYNGSLPLWASTNIIAGILAVAGVWVAAPGLVEGIWASIPPDLLGTTIMFAVILFGFTTMFKSFR